MYKISGVAGVYSQLNAYISLTFPSVGIALHHLIGLSVGSVNKTTKLFADINIPVSTIGS